MIYFPIFCCMVLIIFYLLANFLACVWFHGSNRLDRLLQSTSSGNSWGIPAGSCRWSAWLHVYTARYPDFISYWPTPHVSSFIPSFLHSTSLIQPLDIFDVHIGTSISFPHPSCVRPLYAAALGRVYLIITFFYFYNHRTSLSHQFVCPTLLHYCSQPFTLISMRHFHLYFYFLISTHYSLPLHCAIDLLVLNFKISKVSELSTVQLPGVCAERSGRPFLFWFVSFFS